MPSSVRRRTVTMGRLRPASSGMLARGSSSGTSSVVASKLAIFMRPPRDKLSGYSLSRDSVTFWVPYSARKTLDGKTLDTGQDHARFANRRGNPGFCG